MNSPVQIVLYNLCIFIFSVAPLNNFHQTFLSQGTFYAERNSIYANNGGSARLGRGMITSLSASYHKTFDYIKCLDMYDLAAYLERN